MNINLPTLILNTIGFLLLLGFLKRFLFEPILNMLENQEQEEQKLREEAVVMQAEASALLQEARDIKNGALQEAKKIKGSATEDAARIQRQSIVETKEIQERLEQETQTRIEQSCDEAKRRLMNVVGGLAFEIAEKILSREIAQQDRDRYVQMFKKDIQEKGIANRGLGK